MVTPEELHELKEDLTKITPGEWQVNLGVHGDPVVADRLGYIVDWTREST